jgi:hypothetical protein
MNLDDLRKISATATDRFRLETLPQYLVTHEEEEFAAWKRGDRIRSTPEDSAWLRRIRDSTVAGERWWRVRILDYPLVEYSRYELFGYQDSDAAGQQTFVANRAWHSDLAELHEDFWLFDSKIALRMVYDDEGHFLHPEECDNTQHYLSIRDRAVQHAIPLSDYLREHEPDLIADPIR